jgi:hypothetical protein
MNDEKLVFVIIIFFFVSGLVTGCNLSRFDTHKSLKNGEEISFIKDWANSFKSQNYKCQEITK